MKFISFLLCFFTTVNLSAQNNILKGIISDQNTGALIKGVEIRPTIAGANPVYSDEVGFFSITIKDGKPGKSTMLIIQKEGHQLVGRIDEVLADLIIPEDKEDLAKIVMVRTEDFDKRKDKYVQAIEKQLKDKETEINFMRNQLIGDEISDQERIALVKQLARLSEQVEELENSKEELAKRLAEIDLSKAADFVVEAIEKFEEEGDVEAALEILEEEKLEKLYEQGLRQEVLALNAKAQAVEGYMTRARLQIANFKFKAAYKNYLEAIQKDSVNVGNLWEVANFLSEQNETERAIKYYQQALRHNNNEELRAGFLNNLGVQHGRQFDYKHSENSFLKALKIYERFSAINPDRYEYMVAITHDNLGVLYTDINLFIKAEKAHLKALEIRERLALVNPVRFDPYLADSQNNLGKLYLDLNQYEKAERALLKAFQIRKRLAVSNPIRIAPDLASTLNNLGNLYYEQNLFKKSEKALLKTLEIRESLAFSNSVRFDPYLADSQNNLGRLYSKQKLFKKSEKALLKALEIRVYLAKSNPIRYNPDIAISQYNLGCLYYKQKQYSNSEKAHLEALEIRTQLTKSNPVRFDPAVAESHNNLGALYHQLKSYKKAEKEYLNALHIREDLNKLNSGRYDPMIATSQNNLGILYFDMNLYGQAEKAYLKALRIIERLGISNHARFESNPINTLDDLGNLYLEQNRLDESEMMFLKAVQMNERLAKLNPARFEIEIAKSQNNLASFYFEINKIEKALLPLNESLLYYRKLAKKNPDTYDLEVVRALLVFGAIKIETQEGITALEEARSIAQKYPDVAFAQKVVKDVAILLNSTPLNTNTNKLVQQIQNLQTQISASTSHPQKVKLQKEIIFLTQQLINENPKDQNTLDYAAGRFGNLSWQYLFIKQFKKAEAAARKAISMSNEAEWVNTNLALALLYQGKYNEAKVIFLELKDKPYENGTYKEVFLKDLEELETDGIIHKDVKKIRKLLQ